MAQCVWSAELLKLVKEACAEALKAMKNTDTKKGWEGVVGGFYSLLLNMRIWDFMFIGIHVYNTVVQWGKSLC